MHHLQLPISVVKLLLNNGSEIFPSRLHSSLWRHCDGTGRLRAQSVDLTEHLPKLGHKKLQVRLGMLPPTVITRIMTLLVGDSYYFLLFLGGAYYEGMTTLRPPKNRLATIPSHFQQVGVPPAELRKGIFPKKTKTTRGEGQKI